MKPPNRCAVFFEILLCAVSLASADVRNVLQLRPAPQVIHVDGAVDSSWCCADSAADFHQLMPYFGQPPKYRTVAKVLTSEDALYCLMICYQPSDEIETITGVHDEISGDVVSLMIDTFGDKQSAYKFAVSASGVQADCRLLDDARNRDCNWDGVWAGAAKTYTWGYVVEMQVPYRSIKYDALLQEWGLDFDRYVPSTREDLYWSSYEQNEGQRISKFGRLMLNGGGSRTGGLNLEVYPVGLAKGDYNPDGTYNTEARAGVDVFYNPSEQLTFQLTANPDFAQIEADPYEFNVSRYETYFSERRPFFVENSEIFMASGRQSNSGFYQPIELFYSRRIGKLLPDGTLVPLVVGAKASGRLSDWEYGGFYAFTGAENYQADGQGMTEPRASFASARVKRTVLDNSSIGTLCVVKKTASDVNGVIDIDGALRGPSWQLSYQIARSFRNSTGDFAGSAGLTMDTEDWLYMVRARAIGKNFDVDQVGFVPWKGTVDVTALTGPVWYFDVGAVQRLSLFAGPIASYEDADLYTDLAGAVGLNANFRSNWGFEMSAVVGRSKDQSVLYAASEYSLGAWCEISPRWNGYLHAGYSRSYNFSRGYLGRTVALNGEVEWKMLDVLEIGTSYGIFVEATPEGNVEEITYNARPFFSFTPWNNINIRTYLDILYLRSTQSPEQAIFGFLLSYNFLPKSWIYLAINEVQNRQAFADAAGTPLPPRLGTTDRAAVLKIKYLFSL